MAIDEQTKKGMSRRDAVRAVRLEHENLEATKEIVHAASWESFFETCWQDLRVGLRKLCKSPSFTVVVVLTLALGIGATTAIFALIEAVMLKSLPMANPGQLYRLGDSGKASRLS